MISRKIFLLVILIINVIPDSLSYARKSAAAASATDSLTLLRSALDSVFASPKFNQAQWGVKIASLDRNEVVYERNSGRLLMPASNNKILTVSAALLNLGPDFRYQTQILQDGLITGAILKGNLVIVGCGDPSMAARFHSDDPFSVFKEWAALLKEKGILSIEGAILGEEGAFEEKTFGNGWEMDDMTYGYAAPISAFQFNENQIEIEISPGEQIGGLALLRTSPLEDYLQLKNKTNTVAAGSETSIQVDRTDGGETFTLRGEVPAGSKPIVRPVAVRNPTLYYLQALRKTFENEGVDVTNCEIRAVRELNAASMTLLWTQNSLPLSEIIKPLLKTSQNLYAETLARTLGMTMRSQGSFAAGKEIVEDSLSLMGIEKGTYVYSDGSGLSRQNLISPDLMLNILKFISKNEFFQTFYDALAIASVDGTLEKRMHGTKAANNVHAKTGAFANARAISGYVRTADGEMLAFSIICNNFLISGQAVEAAQDSALNLLANFKRGENAATQSSQINLSDPLVRK